MQDATPPNAPQPFSTARRKDGYRLLELGLTALAFAAVFGFYLVFSEDGLAMRDAVTGCGAASFAFWLSFQLRDDAGNVDGAAIFMEQLCFGAGVALLVHTFITYSLLTRRTPFLVLGGSVAAAALIGVVRRWRSGYEPAPSRILFLGFDGLCQRLIDSLDAPVAGVWGQCEAPVPAGIPVYGPEMHLEHALVAVQPTQIVIGTPECGESVAAGLLLRCKLQGIRITDAAALYEKLFARVCCERLQPGDLLLSSALRGDSRTMAIQAVYNNVIGLAILLLLSPVLLAIAAAVALTSGAGPILESTECAGFQYIPFRLQRFRTTRPDGSRTAVGRALRWLRLVNLPQLFNVVRGDMALVGPRPVRSEFARYLSAQMPFYAYRFSVKPGFGGWAQVHQLGKTDPDTRREIEYDLYYIKEGSLWLDLEILLDRLINRPRAARAPKPLLAERH